MIRLFSAAAVAMIAFPATADTLVQWNFNSLTPDASTSTGTTVPFIGAGTASLVGGATATFASGDANGGSSDPATGDDSGWNTSAYAAQSSGDKTRGAAFATSTLGFQDIVLSFDLRHSNTSSRYEAVQYTLNGTSWIDAIVFDANQGGDKWYSRSVDLSAITGADNNASFAVRVLATFAPGTSSYAATTSGSSYSTTGTWRFDMVTISGSTIPPIPEPGSTALLLAGLGTLGLLARRRA